MLDEKSRKGSSVRGVVPARSGHMARQSASAAAAVHYSVLDASDACNEGPEGKDEHWSLLVTAPGVTSGPVRVAG